MRSLFHAFPAARRFALALLVAVSLTPCHAGRRIRRADITTPAPLPAGSVLVVGFLGGWDNWDHPKRSVRRLALRLRETVPPGVYVESVDNHSRGVVRGFIREALDRNRDGKIDAAEASSCGIILYGQSFGGAATLKLARELKRWNVPVLLTVQVDSVGRDDGRIPSNVRRAANLFQRDPGLVRGQPEIVAEDPSKTQILLNLRHSYLFRDIDISHYPRLSRHLNVSHKKMDNDPLVWANVEQFIRAEIERWRSTHPPRN